MNDSESNLPTQPQKVTSRDLFTIFLKAGLAFGGGLGILAVLEDELVSRRAAMTREEFLTLYGIGRIVPSGTMTALAVGFGYRFGGYPGTVIALTALALPAFIITVILTALYTLIQEIHLLPWLEVSVLPAALALIIAAAFKLGKDVFRPSIDLIIAAAAFVGAYFLKVNPALLLIAGGVIGIFAFRPAVKE